MSRNINNSFLNDWPSMAMMVIQREIALRGFATMSKSGASIMHGLTQRKSFAQVLRNACDIAIKIPEEVYKVSLDEYCKNILHGKLILSTSDFPFKLNDLLAKLVKLWKSLRGSFDSFFFFVFC